MGTITLLDKYEIIKHWILSCNSMIQVINIKKLVLITHFEPNSEYYTKLSSLCDFIIDKRIEIPCGDEIDEINSRKALMNSVLNG